MQRSDDASPGPTVMTAPPAPGEAALREGAGEAPRPLGELVSDLAREMSTLVRKELDLAKAETKTKAMAAAKEGVKIAAGGGLVAGGALALLGALVLALGTVMALWASALLVGIAAVVVGGALAFAALRSMKRIDPVPKETVQTIQEDKLWLREQVSR